MKSAVDFMNKAGRGEVPLDEESTDWEWLPAQLCAELALLILEGRKPEQSVKGRTEGEHCPPARGTSKHQCCPEKESCSQIESVNAYINFLCRNDIPVSVEVLLYPDCCHDNQSQIEVGASAEGGKEQVPGLQEYVVLEQWIIQVLPKRFSDGYSHFHMLMQAVRSFLHFSQLSAWLSKTCGASPANIVYRVCAHGESFADNTKAQPELHTFPFLNISKSSSIQVTVASLPRQPCIPAPACFSPLHSQGSSGKVRTKTVTDTEHLSWCAKEEDFGKHGPKYTASHGYYDQSRCDDAHSAREKSEPFDKHKYYWKHAEESAVCRQLHSVVYDSETRRGSLEREWSLEAIHQKKAQMRNSNKLRDSPKLMRNFPGSHKNEYSSHFSERDFIPQFGLDGRTDSVEDLFNTFTSPVDVGRVNTLDRIHNVVCDNVRKVEDTKYQEKLVELEEGFSSLKLHHIPATPCTAYQMPERERVESSRSTSLGSTDSDQGIMFTAGRNDSLGSEWDEDKDDEVIQEGDDITIDEGCSFECGVFPKKGFHVRDPFGNFQLYCSELKTTYPTTVDSPLCCTPSEKSLDTYSQTFGSSNSLHSLDHDHELCHQPTADLCYIPSSGARVSAEECAARRRHVSGNSQDGLDSSKSNSCETLTNQSAILPSQSAGESQCFNAAVFKNKPQQEANSVKSSPSASPMASPRRTAKARGVCGGVWDDFTPNIPAPFGNGGVQPHLKEEKENSESAFQFPPPTKGKSLLRNVLNKSHQIEEATTEMGRAIPKEPVSKCSMRRSLDGSNSYIFHPRTGLPINSSPAPLRKAKTTNDCPSLLKPIGLTSSPSCNNLEKPSSLLLGHPIRMLSTSAPATSCLLGNFEESVLNGRLEPLGTIDGFTAEIGASGSFCPKHICLPVTTFFYSVCDDDAPSSYFGYINLEGLGRRGYHVPKFGTIQVTLFNPNTTVVKMFVVRYDLSDMPPNCQTFARQRIFYMPSDVDVHDECDKELRYLIHLRFQTTKSGKVYLHTDIRMIFARHSPDLESSFGTFELRSFTEVPTNPRFSPKN
ncbi:atos homolog protein A-like [Diadema setosum]|uniref:atos homolog protein A-like n=1 Tax=Diadema setosum TaxID=31175 RepID=UPI003B3BE14F